MKTETSRIASLLFCLLCFAAGAINVRSQEVGPGKLVTEPYTLRTFDGKEVPAELGKLSVREDRNSKSDRSITLAFVRLKSTAKDPGSPIVWLSGGPGVPGILFGRIPVYFQLFDKLREVSDVILLDQRGTGMSSPNLDCKPFSMPTDVFESPDKWLQVFSTATKECAESWRRQGVNVAAYNNDANADDLEDLRKAIGAERLNLLGHSYGTLLALTSMRRHSDRLDRVVLAATEGSDNLLAFPAVWDSLFNKLSYLAAQDPNVPKTAADLGKLYARVLEKLAQKPLTLTVTDSRTKSAAQIRVGKIGLQWVIRSKVSDARFFSMLPALLSTMDQGDYALLMRLIEPFYNQSLGRSSMAMAIDCSAGWSAQRFALVAREARGALFENVNLQWSGNICREMGLTENGATQTRLASSLPTLFISGTLDPNTPPFQAEEVRWSFTQSVHLIVENGGHETLPSGEVQSVVVDFFKGEDVSNRRVKFPSPKFLTVDEAKKQ